MSHYDVTDFQAEVIERSAELPVLVDFWAEWCGPCKALGPVLEKLAGEADGGWHLAKLDTEAHPRLAAAFGIRSIPAVKLFVDGEVVDEFVGALPEESVRAWLAEAIPVPGAEQLREARELLAAGEPDDVERARQLLLDCSLQEDATNEEARVLLAEANVFDDPAGAAALLGPVGSGDKHGERAEALRTIAGLLEARIGDETPDASPAAGYAEAIEALAQRDFEAALQGFIAASAAGSDDDLPRRACLAIFTLLGDEAELTRAYRKRLARVLFS